MYILHISEGGVCAGVAAVYTLLVLCGFYSRRGSHLIERGGREEEQQQEEILEVPSSFCAGWF